MPWETLGKIWVALIVLSLVGGIVVAIMLAVGIGRGTGIALASGGAAFSSSSRTSSP